MSWLRPLECQQCSRTFIGKVAWSPGLEAVCLEVSDHQQQVHHPTIRETEARDSTLT